MRRLPMTGLALAAAFVAGCAGTNVPSSTGPTAEPSASAMPTVASTPLPTPDVTSAPATARATGNPPVEGLLPMSFAVVATAELNVRVEPSTSAALLETMFVENPLPKDTRVLNLGDAINADGHLWYLAGIPTEDGTTIGWVGSGPADDPWLRPEEVECPPANLAGIISLTPIERLGCFGSRSVGFEARQVTVPEDAGFGGVCGDLDPGVPEWLVCENYNWVHPDGDPDESLNLYFDPATGIAPTGLADPGTVGPLWTIQGHFDDPAAAQCPGALDPTSLEYQTARVGCAVLFVVEDVSLAE